MYYIVYETVCSSNGKIYVGKHKTKNLDDGYLGSGKLLSAAIKKYGRENFKRFTISSHATEAEMNAAEAKIVTEEFCARDDNYNICPGGQGGFGFINQNGLAFGGDHVASSEKGGKRCFELHGGLTKEASRKGGLSIRHDTFLGRRHSEETKEKMRRSHSARPRGPRGPYKKKQNLAAQ